MITRQKFEIAMGGRKIRLGERTLIMGVLNVTPDSFSDGGRYLDPKHAVDHALQMARQGADWIDVGGESTRPGAKNVSTEEELRRVLPVIRALHRQAPSLPISIDTTKAAVAEEAVRAGATILNDVSGLRFDPQLAAVARRHHTLLVLMHLRGRPESMQTKPFAKSIWPSLRESLAWSVRAALDAGVRSSRLIIDPGLGFGKSRRQNFEILARLDRLRSFHLPILVGTSRKSFVQAIVAGAGLDPARAAPRSDRATAGLKAGATKDMWTLTQKLRGATTSRQLPGELLELKLGDAAAVTTSILAGAHIVRVHDVESILPAVRIADAVLNSRDLKTGA